MNLKGLKSTENLVLFCETRPEWLMSALACFRIGVPGKSKKLIFIACLCLHVKFNINDFSCNTLFNFGY